MSMIRASLCQVAAMRSAVPTVCVAARAFSTSFRPLQESVSVSEDGTVTATETTETADGFKTTTRSVGSSPHGTFATFAEYRQAIVKRDPASMETRNEIMAPHEKIVSEPEEMRKVDETFRDLAKKIAY